MDRSHVEGILNRRLNDYMLEAEQDLKLTELNIKEKCLLRSSYAAKWLRYGYEEAAYKKTLTKQVDLIRDKIKQQLFQERKSELLHQSPGADRLMNLEIEKRIITDPDYKKITAAIAIQEEVIRLIGEIQKIISSFGYDISNSKGILQLEQI